MAYFDFVMSEVHGLRIRELLDEKKAGRKIIGSYCVFVPEDNPAGMPLLFDDPVRAVRLASLSRWRPW